MNRTSLIDRLFPLLFDVPDVGSGGGGGGDLGDIEDIAHGQAGDVEIMDRADKGGKEGDGDGDAADDDEGAGDDDETGEEEFREDGDEDENADEDEEEGDEKEGKDDDKDEKAFEGRPTLTDIKNKYPKIFKEFPELREVLFRENEFTKHFGTIEEAEEAAAKTKSFDTIEAGLLAGDPALIYKQLAENAPDALSILAENVLPKLLETSQDLYLKATVPVIEQFIHTAYENGKTLQNKNMMLAAQHLANWFFGKPDIPDPNRRRGDNRPHPAQTELEQKQKQWAQTRFKEASSEVSTGIDSELEAEILKGFNTKGLTDRQKVKFIADVKDAIDEALGKDPAFQRQMKGLWKKAADSDYPKEQRASIKSAFLARAKPLVPSVRTRLRAEWFGDKPANDGGKPGDKKKEKDSGKKRTIPTGSGRSASERPQRPPSPKEVDYSKTSDEDLIAGRFTRKR